MCLAIMAAMLLWSCDALDCYTIKRTRITVCDNRHTPYDVVDYLLYTHRAYGVDDVAIDYHDADTRPDGIACTYGQGVIDVWPHSGSKTSTTSCLPHELAHHMLAPSTAHDLQFRVWDTRLRY